MVVNAHCTANQAEVVIQKWCQKRKAAIERAAGVREQRWLLSEGRHIAKLPDLPGRRRKPDEVLAGRAPLGKQQSLGTNKVGGFQHSQAFAQHRRSSNGGNPTGPARGFRRDRRESSAGTSSWAQSRADQSRQAASLRHAQPAGKQQCAAPPTMPHDSHDANDEDSPGARVLQAMLAYSSLIPHQSACSPPLTNRLTSAQLLDDQSHTASHRSNHPGKLGSSSYPKHLIGAKFSTTPTGGSHSNHSAGRRSSGQHRAMEHDVGNEQHWAGKRLSEPHWAAQAKQQHSIDAAAAVADLHGWGAPVHTNPVFKSQNSVPQFDEDRRTDGQRSGQNGASYAEPAELSRAPSPDPGMYHVPRPWQGMAAEVQPEAFPVMRQYTNAMYSGLSAGAQADVQQQLVAPDEHTATKANSVLVTATQSAAMHAVARAEGRAADMQLQLQHPDPAPTTPCMQSPPTFQQVGPSAQPGAVRPPFRRAVSESVALDKHSAGSSNVFHDDSHAAAGRALHSTLSLPSIRPSVPHAACAAGLGAAEPSHGEGTRRLEGLARLKTRVLSRRFAASSLPSLTPPTPLGPGPVRMSPAWAPVSTPEPTAPQGMLLPHRRFSVQAHPLLHVSTSSETGEWVDRRTDTPEAGSRHVSECEDVGDNIRSTSGQHSGTGAPWALQSLQSHGTQYTKGPAEGPRPGGTGTSKGWRPDAGGGNGSGMRDGSTDESAGRPSGSSDASMSSPEGSSSSSSARTSWASPAGSEGSVDDFPLHPYTTPMTPSVPPPTAMIHGDGSEQMACSPSVSSSGCSHDDIGSQTPLQAQTTSHDPAAGPMEHGTHAVRGPCRDSVGPVGPCRDSVDPVGPRRSLLEQQQDRFPCPHCGRQFVALAHARHVAICLKMFVQKRKPVDMRSRRIGHLLPVGGNAVIASSSSSTSMRPTAGNRAAGARCAKVSSVLSALPKAAGVFTSTSAALPANAVKARAHIGTAMMALHVQSRATTSIDVVEPATSASRAASWPKSWAKPAQDSQHDRQECPHCHRRFSSAAAERHVPACRNIFAKPTRLMMGGGRAAYMRKVGASGA